MAEPASELHPGTVIFSVLLGLLTTFVANLVPSPYNWIAIAATVLALLIWSSVYLSRLPGKRHVALIRYVRFVLVAFLIGVAIGALATYLPASRIDGVPLPGWLADAIGDPFYQTPYFTVTEVAYFAAVATLAVIAYWRTRRLLRSLSLVFSSMAGAVLAHASLEPSFAYGDSEYGLDPLLTYVTWTVLATLVVLLCALLPAAWVELRETFGKAKSTALTEAEGEGAVGTEKGNPA